MFKNIKPYLDYRSNIWIEASAGCGKTKALTDRVITMLLNGINPRKIVCFTFTNMATEEMKIRINQRILSWKNKNISDLESDELIKVMMHNMSIEEKEIFIKNTVHYLIELVHHIDDDQFDENFSKTWVKIQTFHSFCKEIISKFYEFFGISSDFIIAPDCSDILSRASDLIFSKLSHEWFAQKLINDFKLTHEFARIISNIMMKFLSEIDESDLNVNVDNASLDNSIVKIIDDLNGILHDMNFFYDHRENDLKFLCKKYDVPYEYTIHTDLFHRYVASSEYLWLINRSIENFLHYRSLFLTIAGEIRKSCEKNDVLFQEGKSVYELNKKIEKLHCNMRKFFINYICCMKKKIFDELKMVHSILDYDDLVNKVYEFFMHNPSHVVINGLANDIDHILVDEAQDINPKQWEIIYKICEDFACSSKNFTICCVGDPKQSIYSFHLASQELYYKYCEKLEKLFGEFNRPWVYHMLNKCFRCADIILQKVDKIFIHLQIEKNYQGHIGCGKIGVFEVWPLVQKSTNDDMGYNEDIIMDKSTVSNFVGDVSKNSDVYAIECVHNSATNNRASLNRSDNYVLKNMTTVLQNSNINSTNVCNSDDINQHKLSDIGLYFNNSNVHNVHEDLSKKIIAKIELLYENGFAYKDMMILFRNRNEMFNTLVKEMMHKNIPCVFNISMKMIDNDMVSAIMSAIKLSFCFSDSSLSGFLKKIHFSLEELSYFVQYGKNSHKNLDFTNLGISHLENIDLILNLFRKSKMFIAIHSFYVDLFDNIIKIVAEKNAIYMCFLCAKLVRKYMHEDDEIFEHFTSILYNYSGANDGFAIFQWLSKKISLINLPNKQDGVKILTVHASKGLESEIVFMPDTTVVPKNSNDEYYRLLYVAMTRAKSHLYVCGWGKIDGWYKEIIELS